ncbi:MAG TPA: peroxiredoxin [Steroidobacteraceae bacterium]|nr:peroxiredoxin [Steroidobacteraceae bacterium]HRX89179.1 peroxiredoxin [Steroidobacteraceae bacterium]
MLTLRRLTVAILAAATLQVAVAETNDAGTPAVGSPAPAFKLQDQTGKWTTLEQQRGKWVVLYFYPKDNTPGCTTQACELRDNIFAFRRADAVILGVSVDDVASHKKFSEDHSLPFPILADSSKATAKAYGVLYKAMGIMEVARRDTFLIDPAGKIAKHYKSVNPKGHSEMVLADLKQLAAKAAAVPAAAPAS